MKNPIFIVGVPRSGSTMLRMVLDSHPRVFSTVELPWIGGNYRSDGYDPEVSLRCLYQRILRSAGPSNTVEPERIRAAFRQFLHTSLRDRMPQNGDAVWVEKTPDNIIQVPFLAELFPGARFVRVLRDGRDVALSTVNTEWRALNYFIERNRTNLRWIQVRKAVRRRLYDHLPVRLQDVLLKAAVEPQSDWRRQALFYPLANTFYNALYRWKAWNQVYERHVAETGVSACTVRYEDLLRNAPEQFANLFRFIGLDWDPKLLQYGKFPHDTREGDIGIRSALRFSGVDQANAFKWKQQLTPRQSRLVRRYFDDYLELQGYERTRREVIPTST